jgi:diadenosine tetraphosphate (Ap4A) HIT family hydrolase
MSEATPCPFCEIVAGRAPAEVVERWPDTIAIRPLNPVADGHLLVIPCGHVEDALCDPAVTGLVMQRAVQVGRLYRCDLQHHHVRRGGRYAERGASPFASGAAVYG